LVYHHDVRTTLSIDDDIAAIIEQEMRRSGASLKETVNRFLRLGLIAAREPGRRPFRVVPRALGLPPGMNYDNVEELIESLEGATHR
jgi:hypothetical protein